MGLPANAKSRLRRVRIVLADGCAAILSAYFVYDSPTGALVLHESDSTEPSRVFAAGWWRSYDETVDNGGRNPNAAEHWPDKLECCDFIRNIGADLAAFRENMEHLKYGARWPEEWGGMLLAWLELN